MYEYGISLIAGANEERESYLRAVAKDSSENLDRLNASLDAAAPAYRRIGDWVIESIAPQVGSNFDDRSVFVAVYETLNRVTPEQTPEEIKQNTLRDLYGKEAYIVGVTKDRRGDIFADHDLCQKVAAGDKDAMDAFVQKYHRLGMKIANKVIENQKDTVVDHMDLYQEIMIHLLRKAGSFMPDRGARFHQYATQALTQIMYTKLQDLRNVVHVPAKTLERVSAINAANWQRTAQQRPLLSDEEIAEWLKIPVSEPRRRSDEITVKTLRQAAQMTRYMGSIDTGWAPGEDTSPGNSYRVDERRPLAPVTAAEEPEQDPVPEAAFTGLRSQAVFDALAKQLSLYHADIVTMRYGIGSYSGESLTQTQISERLGISGRRVHTIIKQTMAKLRAADRQSNTLADWL
ncbi:hypothetical protein CSA80_04545 [Candidatus Saccharibacteria bacterium]|nr:MAG: hypothetical protein CR973_01380 [Candidatus Saccharibacteria bacterium]PID98937.1 MAG: hypothetical protein CSA80_04545 [Candidatus Saccharibacteria bacterium]